MKIVRFSTPKSQPVTFQDQKISLSKLSQVKAHSNTQFAQQQSYLSNNSMKSQKLQSHIKWIPEHTLSEVILNEVKNLIVGTEQSVKQPKKKIVRRKIFQQESQVSKQNCQIPTFTKMPSMNNVTEQQTHFYSMTIHSPKEANINTSKISESKQYRSPFNTNEQNSRLESHNQLMFSNTFMNSSDKSSFVEITQCHLPRLQQKLKEHDEQLSTIKKYLKKTEQLNNMKQSIQEYQQIQALTQKQKQIQTKRELLLQKIEEFRNKQRSNQQRNQDQADLKIKQIQEERLRRLQKMQKQNQRLYQNLKDAQFEQPQFQQNRYDDYHFQGPVAFPSKDWQSQRQIMMPMSQGFKRSSNNNDMISKIKPYNTGEVEISPIMKKKLNEISQIGFSNNKTESFSMEANTFREIMSPLDIQGQNQTW